MRNLQEVSRSSASLGKLEPYGIITRCYRMISIRDGDCTFPYITRQSGGVCVRSSSSEEKRNTTACERFALSTATLKPPNGRARHARLWRKWELHQLNLFMGHHQRSDASFMMQRDDGQRDRFMWNGTLIIIQNQKTFRICCQYQIAK